MNRKGSISTTLLVIMTLVLVGVALFSFYNKSKEVKTELIDSYFLNKFYGEENKIETSLNLMLEETLLLNYAEALSDSSASSAKELVKNRLNQKIDASPYKYFEVKYEDEVHFSGEMNEPIVGCLNSDKTWEWGEFSGSDECKIGIIYRPNIDVVLNFKSIGLVEIDEFFSALNTCKGSSEVEKCLESNLPEFETEFNEESRIVVFRSKQLYFLDAGLTPIEFERNFAQDL